MEQFVLNTNQTRESVDRLNAVALYADWTQESPEITRLLDWFDSKSIPLTGIFSGQEKKVYVLRDVYTKGTLLDRLERAGPSAPTSEQARAHSTEMR